jgi:hypothetical protein
LCLREGGKKVRMRRESHLAPAWARRKEGVYGTHSAGFPSGGDPIQHRCRQGGQRVYGTHPAGIPSGNSMGREAGEEGVGIHTAGFLSSTGTGRDGDGRRARSERQGIPSGGGSHPAGGDTSAVAVTRRRWQKCWLVDVGRGRSQGG